MSATPLHTLPPAHVGIALISVTTVLGLLAIITTFCRIAVRWKRRAIGWDDILMIAATIVAIVRFSIIIYATKIGYGHHEDTLSRDQYIAVNFFSWLGQIFLFVCLCLLKISIGLLVMRIKEDRKSRIFQWGIIAGLVLSNLEVLIVLLAECRPVSAYWNPRSGECWSTKIRIYSIYVQVGYGILTDLIYSLMPIIIVRRLRMSTQKKIGICALTWMGLIATICAALRASSLGLRTTDLSWQYAVTAIYGNIEVGMGIVAANFVLIRSFLTFLHERRPSGTRNSAVGHCTVDRGASRAENKRQSMAMHRVDTAVSIDTIVDTESQTNLRPQSDSDSAVTTNSEP